MKTPDNEITNPQAREECASKIAERADKAADEHRHQDAEVLYLLAAARASSAHSAHMSEKARKWDRDAARQRRLADLATRSKP